MALAHRPQAATGGDPVSGTEGFAFLGLQAGMDCGPKQRVRAFGHLLERVRTFGQMLARRSQGFAILVEICKGFALLGTALPKTRKGSHFERQFAKGSHFWALLAETSKGFAFLGHWRRRAKN